MKIHNFLLIAFLLLSTGSTQSQGPTPGPPKISQEQQTKATTKKTDSNTNQYITDKISSGIEISPTQPPNPEEANYAKHSNKTSSLNWTVFDLLLVIFNGILAGSTFLLWRSTYKLWKASKDQREDVRASIAEAVRSADATEKAAEAARKSAEALPAIERAYLFVSAIDYTGKSDIRSTEIFIECRNYGKTPAIMKQIYVGMVFGRNCPREIGKVVCTLIKSGKVIGAGEAQTHRETAFFEWSKLGEQKPDFTQIPTIGNVLVDTIVYGIIEYKDIFSDSLVRIHRFCWHRDHIDGVFRACGNEEVNYHT